MRRPKAVSQDSGDWYTLIKKVYWCILGYRACADVPKTARSNIKIIFVNRGSHSGCHSEYEFDGTAELPVLTNNTDHSYCETEKKLHYSTCSGRGSAVCYSCWDIFNLLLRLDSYFGSFNMIFIISNFSGHLSLYGLADELS